MGLRPFRRILVTGGAGFIGSHFVRLLLALDVPEVVVLDKLTYAGSLLNLEDVLDDPRVRFLHGDIADPAAVSEAIAGCDAVVNFAAETHVDRSLLAPAAFVQTNVWGTMVLLEQALRVGVQRFLHVSTDEVYGEILVGAAREADPLRPRNPYAASKAAAEHFVFSYWTSYGLPVLVTRGCNTYGPYQYPEKFIPLAITNLLSGQPVPIYGDGLQERDWLYVEDHCHAIWTVLVHGKPSETYNIGASQHRPNIEVARAVIRLLNADPASIVHVADRPGHDRRYAVDWSKLAALGWTPRTPFEEGLARTVTWYRHRADWWTARRDEAFAQYYAQNYGNRSVPSSEPCR
ncbi:MAG: dTDP-glucose 4,6-dehydratase [Thermomicrobium sp.]|nr:dTDP-glucose 4,6-dehydratase [Thermomicrobium sp.]MDW8006807.1 dTDP-glucose 4,6-dehydratase [Thermomicrobium sp.]